MGAAFDSWDEGRIVGASLRPPARLGVSDWAGEHIWLDARTSSEPGRLRVSRAPYQRGILDAFGDPGISRITVMSSAQVGKTLSLFCMAAYAIDQDPGPGLYVMPTENAAKTISRERIGPLVDLSPALRAHLTGRAEDKATLKYHFDRMTLMLAWANSPTALASHPIRYVWMDEIDKYPPYTGVEADPVKLAEVRTATFWNRKIVMCSTPTTDRGYIAREYGKSDRRRYHVPCPRCGTYQALVFPQVKFPEEHGDPERIAGERLAWYECAECGAPLTDTDKPGMLERGAWTAEGASGPHAGFHLSALYSPWLTWSEVVREFLISKDRPELLMNFVNSWLGEVWRESTEEVSGDQIKTCRAGYRRGTVPEGGLVLTAGADVHKSDIHYVVRAWGYDETSWLVAEGVVADFGELEEAVIRGQREGVKGRMHGVRLTCIDSGYRTNEVYDFSRRWGHCVYATKGASTRQSSPYHATLIPRDPVTGKALSGQRLWHLDTMYYKDKVHHFQTTQPGKWWLYEGVSEAYLHQVVAEHRVLKRNRQTGRTTAVWAVKPDAGDNHFWDCEVLATAAADMCRVPFLRREDVGAGAARRDRPRLTTPDGRPFYVGDRA